MIMHSYEYTVLRYIHDPLSQEALNIGVAVYSKEGRFFQLSVNTLYGRLSDTFAGFDGTTYRRTIHQLNQKAAEIERRMFSGDWTLQPPEQISDVLPLILIPNDSSLMFGNVGSGLTPNLTDTLQSLYERLVTRHAKSDDALITRDDPTIWKVFASELSKRRIIEELQPKIIETPTFEYEFDFAWKNETWHPLQPISLDLQRAESIRGKAHRWIGNLQILRKNQELGTVYFLIGKPHSMSDEVQKAYSDALENMRYGIEDIEIYEEDHADQFAARLADRIARHKEQIH